MDRADEELRHTVKKLWPLQSQSQLNLLIPPKYELHGKANKRRMTVGKIYAGFLILENYRSYKQACSGNSKPRRSSFFNRIMGVVRNNANFGKSCSTLNSSESDQRNVFDTSVIKFKNV